MKERFVEEIEDHGEWVLTRTIKEVWHKKKDLEEEAKEEQEEEERKKWEGITMERLPDVDNCSKCGGYFTD
mgnify:CR=1 FL=1